MSRAVTLLCVVFAAFALFAAGSASAVVTHDPLTGVFSDWMREHAKSYSNEEFVYRWNVWRENHAYIQAHNARGNASYHLAMNRFGDLTNAEFNRLFKGLLPTVRSLQVEHAVEANPSALGLPADFDWRQKGAVTHVKNQGQCGSCWSFSATGSTEGANFLKSGRLTSLSEQNLVDCSTRYGNHGCNGGLMDNAFEYIIHNKGIDTEASYPYHASQGTCRYNPANSGGTLVSFADVPSGNENALLQALSTQPVSVAIDASHNSFQFYKGGVYDEPACSSTQLDHGVLAVGWGTHEGREYWLVKNSWGSDWGLQGYIMMSRNKHNQCGIATAASHPRA